jgi:hypothetical protein
MVGSISRVSHPKRREEDVALELSLDMENEELHHSDGRKEDLEGIGAMFDGWMNMAGHRKGGRMFYEEIVDCLAGIA